MPKLSNELDKKGILIELQQVKEEAATLKNIISQSPAIAFSWKANKSWQVEFVSENVSQLGYTPKDFYSGKVTIPQIIHPEERNQVLKKAIRLIYRDNLNEFNQEYRMVKADGSSFWVDTRLLVIRNEQGAVTNYQGILIDITEQKKAYFSQLESKKILRTVIDNIPQLIFWKDRNSHYIGCNKAFATDHHFNHPKSVIGVSDKELNFNAEELKNIRETDQEVMKTDKPLMNLIYKDSRFGEQEKIKKTDKVPLFDINGKIIGVVGTTEDITERIRAEQNLADSEAKYRSLFNSANDAIFLCAINEETQSGHFLEVNDIACKRYSYTKEEFLQLTIDDLDDPDFLKKANRRSFQYIAGNKNVFEVVHLTKGGNKIPVEISTTCFTLQGRNYVTAIARDITKRKRVEQELTKHKTHLELLVAERTAELSRAKEQKEEATKTISEQWDFLRTLIDFLPTLIYVKDTQSRFITANKATIKIMGAHTREVLVGTTDFDYYDKALANKFFNDEKKLLRGEVESINVEELITDQDGKDHWYHTIKLPLKDRDNSITGLIGIGHDITKRKLIEEEREKLIVKAEAANRAKSAFLANMSHEIRTPMNGVVGMASLLLDTSLDHTQRQYTELLRRSGEFLLSIINDILDFSKIEAGKLELQDIDFNLLELIYNFTDIVTVKAQNKNVELEVVISPNVPLHLKGDPDRLQQILMNLTTNGLKFTEVGTVTLRFLVESQSDNIVQLRFEVQDTGIGIAKDKQPHLFESFSQLDTSTTKKFGGTGLGLAISKELCELMGGQIDFVSEEGKGTTFWFTAKFGKQPLPNNFLQPYDKKGRNVVVSGIETFKQEEIRSEFRQTADEPILLAEDNHINQQVVLGILAKLGFSDVDTVTSGNEVLHALRKKEYRLILMDISMPNMDGMEATKQIRQQKRAGNLHNIPIIALTAHAIKGDREKCLQAGMNDYLTKPINTQQLKKVLQTWLVSSPVQFQAAELEKRPDSKGSVSQPKHLNFEKLVQRLMDDRVIAIEIINAFIEAIPEEIGTLKRHLIEKNLKLTKHQAHKVKGAAANIEAANIEKIAFIIEQKCLSEEHAELQKLVERLEHNFKLVKDEIEQICSQ